MYRVYRNQTAAIYSSLYFFIFFSLQFSDIKRFPSHFSQEPWGLEGWNLVQCGQMYRVYWNQAAAAYSFLDFFSFLFLQFSNSIKNFVALFSETVRPIKLTLDTLVDNGWMYHVYRNQTAASYLSLFYFVSSVQKFKIFVTLFSGTVRPKMFKLGTLVDNGWLYHVYQNQAAACLSLYFFIFLSLQLSNIYNFCHICLRNCEA